MIRLVRLLSGFICALLAVPGGAALADPPAFAPVTPGRTLAFPQDYGAHPEYRTEWWYVTGWLSTPDGKPLGFQVTFFRSRTEHDPANPSAFAPKQLIIGHAALSYPALGHLMHDQRSARAGFDLAYANTGTTDVKLDDWSMRRESDGRYRVVVRAGELSFTLRLAPTQALLPQGAAGYSQKGPQASHASYYYSEPQLRVTGSVVRPNGLAGSARGNIAVTGMAWLDHEWSSTLLDANAVGWDWLGANLADGSALMAFRIRSRNGHAMWAHAALRDPAGRVTAFGPDQVVFTPVRTWRSARTNTLYPVSMDVGTGPLKWRLDPLMDDQELDSRLSTGAVYWEGAVKVSRESVEVGRGYLELTGYADALRIGKR